MIGRCFTDLGSINLGLLLRVRKVAEISLGGPKQLSWLCFRS